MPYPAKLDPATLTDEAWMLLDTEGVEAFSMHRLAAVMGVKTASLYRYFDRESLLRAVNTRTIEKLFAHLAPHIQPDAVPQASLMAVARAYRAFAHAHPVMYGLVYADSAEAMRPDAAWQEAQVLPLQAIMARQVGDARSLVALRALLALMHGWIMLEAAQQFRRGGDLDAHFERAVQAVLNGWA